MALNNVEAYWQESVSSPFNFDDDEDILDPLTDVQTHTTITENRSILSLDLIISQSGLDLILDDISSSLEYVVPPVNETITKALIGHNFSFEIYKRFGDKINLLDAALDTFDGNIILKVVLFLRSTLRPNIFFQLLVKRKLAVNHFSYHLISTNRLHELIDLYIATGNSSNLKQVFYLSGRDTKNKSSLHKKLKQFSIENLQTLTSLDDKLEVQDNLHFLEWQIEKNESADSVIEQLAVLYRSEWQKSKHSNEAMEFKNLLRIDEMTCEWTAMNVMASMQLWPQIAALFVKPNWFSKKNFLKTTISHEIFVYGLSKHKPPKDVLEQFLCYMADSDKSMILAQKLHCHKYVIQQYINQKDRLALIAYKTRLSPNEEDYFLIENALQSTVSDVMMFEMAHQELHRSIPLKFKKLLKI